MDDALLEPTAAGEFGPHPLAAGRRACSLDQGEGPVGVVWSPPVNVCMAVGLSLACLVGRKARGGGFGPQMRDVPRLFICSYEVLLH